MAITVNIFRSVQELQIDVERSIAESKKILGQTFTKTEEVRGRYNDERKKNGESRKDTKQMEIAGFRVLVNPTVDYELRLMEESATSIQEKINAFEKVKELYPKLTAQDMKIAMILNDGVPSGFMFFVPHL